MDKYRKEDEFADLWGKFIAFEECKRDPKTQTVNEYILDFDTKYNNIEKKGLKFVEPILAFKLL